MSERQHEPTAATRPHCERPPWHPDCYWPNCKCGQKSSASTTDQPDLSGNASIAAKQLEEHLATEALGGGHPVMVVVPREALLTLLDGYRRYLSAAVHHTIEEGRRARR